MPSDWPWLRLYSEARTDKKLQALSDAMHRVWFNLLCYAGEQPKRGEIRDHDEYLLAIECSDGDEPLLRATLEALERLGIVAIGDGEDDYDTVRFLAWEKRQYDKPSDRPEATAERKRKSRSLKEAHAQSRDVTPSHAPDTEEELDTDTDLETEREENEHDAPAAPVRGYPPDFEAWWKRYPSGHGNKKASAARWAGMSVPERRAAEDGLGKWLACGRWKRGMVKAAEIWLRDEWWSDTPPDEAARASPSSNGSIWDEAIVNARARDLADESGRNGASASSDRYPLLADPEYRRPQREPDGGDVDAGVGGHSVEAVWREGP